MVRFFVYLGVKLFFTMTLFVSIIHGQFPPSISDAQAHLSSASLATPFVDNWTAFWITHPTANTQAYGVFHFRKTIQLAKKPVNFVVNVSADNRYKLYVNGVQVGMGPARSDLAHWNYETIDIAEHLQTGKNTIAAVVWNFTSYLPVAQITRETAFILQGNSIDENIVNTDTTWKIIQDNAYTPIPVNLGTYIVVGPGDKVDGGQYPWGWQRINYDDSQWLNAKIIVTGNTVADGSWILKPRDIPVLENSVQNLKTIRRQNGSNATDQFLSGNEKLSIPDNTTATLILDNGFETIGYPELLVSQGNGSEIELTYAEALFDSKGQKGNRNEIEGKNIKGIIDKFYPTNLDSQVFSPLWFRTFRYIQLRIETKSEPVTLDKLNYTFTGYPFEEKAYFKSNDENLAKIWEIGWQTIRLCSNETYFDCPYYEQLQYIGDTRIQALISLYISGDDRLMRKALRLVDWSRLEEGITMSRVPSNVIQIIPPFSLFWTNMVHDYWMLRNDPALIGELLPGIEAVLGWYENKINFSTGMLGPTPYWNFVDWATQWPWNWYGENTGGSPKGGKEGGSSILTLQFAYALNEAAELFTAYGKYDLVQHYLELANQISDSTIALCWDSSRQLLADTPEKNEFSQHAQVMAILSGAKLPVESKELMARVASDNTLIQCTFYYRFYLTLAMKKAGLGDNYLNMLDPWYQMIGLGLTTFAETPDPTRSDCHGWSASPNYDFLATVCGIEPAEPGFKTVRIAPHLGDLQWVEGQMPHPNGMIIVNLQTLEHGLKSDITLPPGLTGKFINGETEIPLHEGTQSLTTGIDQSESIIKDIQVKPNYPNPFNSKTTIQVYLPLPKVVSFKVYNVLGQLISLKSEDLLQEGWHQIIWPDENLNPPSGIYFYHLIIDGQNFIHKMLVLK